jgi:hypothetical protein
MAPALTPRLDAQASVAVRGLRKIPVHASPDSHGLALGYPPHLT